MRNHFKLSVFALISIFLMSCSGYAAVTRKSKPDSAAKAAVQSKAEELYKKATELYNLGKYSEAMQLYKQALDEVEGAKKQLPKCKLLLKKQDESNAAVVKQAAQKKDEPQLQKQQGQVLLVDQKGGSPRNMQDQAIVPSKSSEYIICEQDVLFVYVWQNDDLSQEVLVRPDGRISFPLIGDVQAKNLTIPQLSLQITEKLKEYIKYPQVTVSIRKISGQRVFVLGQVRLPGIYFLGGDRSVMEALSYAGWVIQDSLSSSVVVIKGALTAHPRAFRISLNEILRGKAHQKVMILEAGDIVYVPKKPIADMNYLVSTILDPIAKGSYTAQSLMWFF